MIWLPGVSSLAGGLAAQRRRFDVASGTFLFTSESVSMGHPDKLADQISDGVLDALLAEDPLSRVACETLVTTDFCVLAGEITSRAKVDYEKVARQVIREVGYVDPTIGFAADTCQVLVKLHSQSPDIARGVDEKAEEERKPAPATRG